MNIKDVENFFKEVQKESNYIDIGNIKPVYYAILRTILKGLKDGGKVDLPDWGEYRLIKHKGRRSIDLNNPGQFLILPEIKTVKFSPIGRLKNFAKNIKDDKLVM